MWKSKKFFVLVIMSVSMSFFSCTGVRGMFYDPPIPTQDYFENVSFKLYIYSEKDFEKIVEFYFGSPDPTCAGLTLMLRPDKERIVIIPKDKEGKISLWSLGHEIFYHVVHDYDDSHKIPRKKE